jgi:hypothetical protein
MNTLTIGTKVDVKGFTGYVVAKTQLSALGLTNLDEGFVAVKDENDIVHAFWVDDERSPVKVAEVLTDGAVYKDAIGDFWQYAESAYLSESSFYAFGSATEHDVDTPVRPLTRLDA